MKHIELIKTFDLQTIPELDRDKEVSEIYSGASRRVVEVKLQNGAVLARHKADVPITVFCFYGTGIFRAGRDLEDSCDLSPGSLITLEAGIEHAVEAKPSLGFILTKFTAAS